MNKGFPLWDRQIHRTGACRRAERKLGTLTALDFDNANVGKFYRPGRTLFKVLPSFLRGKDR